MSRVKNPLQFALSFLLLVSISCNLPAANRAQKNDMPTPKVVEIANQKITTENVTAFAEGLTSDPGTAELMGVLRAEGYKRLVEGGDFSYSNGSSIHAVSVTNDRSLVVLTQIVTNTGKMNVLILQPVDQDTVLLRNQTDTLELTIQKDGTISSSVRATAGEMVPLVLDRNPLLKLASIFPQNGSTCTSGMALDYEECMRRKYNVQENLYCATTLAGLVGVCMVPPYADCLPLVGLFLVTCGTNYRDCMDEMVDDPPTADFSKPKELEIFNSCLNDTLFTESLFQVQVICKDDRQPKPNDITVNLTSGDAKDYTCTDCSGRTVSGTIPPPGEVTSVLCDYGCQVVGDGNDRCLKKGETPQVLPQEGSKIPAGTYIGITTLAELFGQGKDAQYYAGPDIENKIEITVAEDGTVTGGLSWIRDGKAYLYENGECSASNYLDYQGTISGILNGEKGEIRIKIKGIITHTPHGCTNQSPYQVETSDELTASVSIMGDTMDGTIPGSFSFEASK